MSEVTLLPCPFCGETTAFVVEWDYEGLCFTAVRCPECGVRGPKHEGDDYNRGAAVYYWNTRAAAEPSEDDVERVARALYEHFVQEQLADDYVEWDRLPGKEEWRARARAALAAQGPQAMSDDAARIAALTAENARLRKLIVAMDDAVRDCCGCLSHADDDLMAEIDRVRAALKDEK